MLYDMIYDIIQNGMIQYYMIWCDMIYDMVWYNNIQYGMIRYYTIWYEW